MARRRKRIMGIPVGPAKKSLPLARMGAIGATAMAALPVAQRGFRAVGRGQELASRGQDLAGTVGDALGVADDLKGAVSSHSSPIAKAASAVKAAAQGGGEADNRTPKLAHLVEEHTDVSVPRSVAYNQWTQMELLPSITKGVDAVDQLSDDRTEWISKIGPVSRRWKAAIVEQVPDERIAWRSESGPEHRGVVTFHSLDEDLTRVMVQMHYIPHGPLETVANTLRVQRRRVRRDLRLFKHFVDLRGESTGEWRGEIGDGPQGRDRKSTAKNSGARSRRKAST